MVRALGRLIRFRNAHPAFGGEFTVAEGGPGELVLTWRAGAELAELEISPGDGTYRITFSAEGGELLTVKDAADLPH